MATSPSFKAAILVNARSSLDDDFNAAFQRSIIGASPGAQIDFFDPIEAQTYPKPGDYDLIVLTGGTYDAAATDVPWILKLREFLTTTVESCPTQKILGICWGHQVIQVVFGGVIGPMGEGKFEVGVTPVRLNGAGRTFFSPHLPSPDVLNIHQFHEIEVKRAGKGFVALAEYNQCLIDTRNTILSFQGHPEMDAKLSRLLLGFTPRYMGNGDEEREATKLKIESMDDSVFIWKCIVQWTCSHRY